MTATMITATAIKADAETHLANGSGKIDTPMEIGSGVSLEDFYAYLPSHQYFYVPTRELWPASSVDSQLKKINNMAASRYIDQNRSVQSMTWAPGEPLIICDRLIKNGGWSSHDGATVLNLYQEPECATGNENDVQFWLDHIKEVFPDAAGYLVRWLAHRVQRPAEKINHAIVLGGGQGIGKDSILEPVKYAVGPWNFEEIGPHNLLGQFNGFSQSVILRISEARDLGDVDRYAFYERIKNYTAAPPDVLRVNEKNRKEYSIPNVCGVVITTNHPDALYLPADDRRHFVAWSEKTKDDFKSGYWRDLWSWLNGPGKRNVAAYLRAVDIRDFDPKTPPSRTEAWRRIVDSGRAPEEPELEDVIDTLGRPQALTLEDLSSIAMGTFRDWLLDRKNRRVIPHRLGSVGYVPVRNPSAKDGFWKIKNRRQAVYSQRELTENERLRAAGDLK